MIMKCTESQSILGSLKMHKVKVKINCTMEISHIFFDVKCVDVNAKKEMNGLNAQ